MLRASQVYFLNMNTLQLHTMHLAYEIYPPTQLQVPPQPNSHISLHQLKSKEKTTRPQPVVTFGWPTNQCHEFYFISLVQYYHLKLSEKVEQKVVVLSIFIHPKAKLWAFTLKVYFIFAI